MPPRHYVLGFSFTGKSIVYVILVMDQGQVVQQGRHETLIEDLDGAYARLLQETV